jgi:hypothetical protein
MCKPSRWLGREPSRRRSEGREAAQPCPTVGPQSSSPGSGASLVWHPPPMLAPPQPHTHGHRYYPTHAQTRMAGHAQKHPSLCADRPLKAYEQTRQRRAEPKQRTKAAADAVRLARLRDLGRAIAKKFARDGAASIGVDYGNHAAAARDAVSRIKALGAEAVALQAELAGGKAGADRLWSTFEAAAAKDAGSLELDRLVDNAGIAPAISLMIKRRRKSSMRPSRSISKPRFFSSRLRPLTCARMVAPCLDENFLHGVVGTSASAL